MWEFRVFAGIVRARDLSGWAKALWTIAIITVPLLGMFRYLVVDVDTMSFRDIDDMRAADEATSEYVRQAAGTGAIPRDQLVGLAESHSSCAPNDAQYEQAEAKVIHG